MATIANFTVEGPSGAGSPAGNPVAIGYTDGSGNVVAASSTNPAPMTGTVTGNVASGATDSGNPVKVAGKYNASPPTFTDGQRGDMQIDAAGNVKETLATLIAGEDIPNNRLYVETHGTANNISSNTTTVVKSGAGLLHSITINTKGASSNTATVYDNTAGSGTKLATIDTTSAIGALAYNIVFSTGLTIVTATGTAPDITVSYR